MMKNSFECSESCIIHKQYEINCLVCNFGEGTESEGLIFYLICFPSTVFLWSSLTKNFCKSFKHDNDFPLGQAEIKSSILWTSNDGPSFTNATMNPIADRAINLMFHHFRNFVLVNFLFSGKHYGIRSRGSQHWYLL